MIELAILVLGCMGASLFPPIWVIMIAYLGGLLVQGVDPLVLTGVSALGGIIGSSLLWKFDHYVERLFSHIGVGVGKLLSRHNKKSIHVPQWASNFYNKVTHGTNSTPMILFALYGLRSPIPDILVIRAIREKVSYYAFFVLLVIAKTLAYAPYIYGIEIGFHLLSK